MQFVFATHNAHKRAEVQAIMAQVWPEVELIAPFGEAPVEDGESFEDNALIKARAGFEDSGLPTIADDSGISVDALGGEPGIHSARYHPSGDDRENLNLLLERMTGIDDRRAQFVCVAALVDYQGEVAIERRWSGKLATAPRGSAGFGYDPIFVPEGSDQTAAEWDPAKKNERSHRAQAFQALAEALKARYRPAS